jgi:hypothetical protein
MELGYPSRPAWRPKRVKEALYVKQVELTEEQRHSGCVWGVAGHGYGRWRLCVWKAFGG